MPNEKKPTASDVTDVLKSECEAQDAALQSIKKAEKASRENVAAIREQANFIKHASGSQMKAVSAPSRSADETARRRAVQG